MEMSSLYELRHSTHKCTKVSPDWICAVTSRFTKLFYCEGANIAHIQSGVTLVLDRTYTRDRDCYVVKRDLDWPVAPEVK